MPASPGGSLFASDYSLSTPPSPASNPPTPPPLQLPTTRSTPSPRPTITSPTRLTPGGSTVPLQSSPLRRASKPIDVVFDTTDMKLTLPAPSVSPYGAAPGPITPVSPFGHSADPFREAQHLSLPLSRGDSGAGAGEGRGDSLTREPEPVSRKKKGSYSSDRKSVKDMGGLDCLDEDPLDVEMRKGFGSDRKRSASSAQPGQGYHTYEACMEGGLGHETKSASYKPGTEKAYHHLCRASDLFAQALHFKPSNPRALLARAKVLISLASAYQPPRTATLSLRECVGLLRELVRLAPKSVSARETLAQACALLSQTLLETDDGADDEAKMWEGPIGSLAREALQCLEDVAADKMDRMRELKQDKAAEEAPEMAETFLALSTAAIAVSSLATDLGTVDLHVELAEQALDQASNMATVAAAARVKSSTSSANLITRVQLASGRSSLERLRHTFTLGMELDEDDFRSLMADMAILATEWRERAAKLKGSKAAGASSLAWEAIKQLADAKMLYASLLRLVWRKRKPRMRNGSGGKKESGQRKGSGNSRSGSLGKEATIKEEDAEEEEGDDGLETAKLGKANTQFNLVPTLSYSPETGAGDDHSSNNNPAGSTLTPSRRAGSLVGSSRKDSALSDRRESASSTGSGKASGARKGSELSAMPEDEEVSHFRTPPLSSRRSFGGSFSLPTPGRRGSWLPSPTGGDASFGRSRRGSSMSAPLVGPDGISAWSRKASVISLSAEEEAAAASGGMVPSAELAKSAWELLEGAVKQYKLALSLLSQCDMPAANLARAKTETLTAIAYAALFQASLAPRLAVALEKRTSMLVTAEVYATWAAREVGWSFLIEGTREAQLADRRTNSWRADEAGKRAVMLLVRVWWHRAVTTETIDVETKTAAKDAVEVVVRRMREREGVRDGDVMRWRRWLGLWEGEMDSAEGLFWRSVARILRGGQGFVMS